MSDLKPPNFIARAEIVGAPLNFRWEGRSEHIGPGDGTQLHSAFHKICVAAEVGLCATIHQWMLWRLQPFVEFELFWSYNQATLAWAVHPAYRGETKGQIPLPEQPPAPSAAGQGCWYLHAATDTDFWEAPGAPPVYPATALAFMAKHVMPKRGQKPFTDWLQWALKQMNRLAPFPKKRLPDIDEFGGDMKKLIEAARPYVGVPYPPEAFDPDSGFKPEDRAELVDKFLQSLDWEKNPFLQSPKQMKAAGFKGTPYRYKEGSERAS